MDSDLFRRLALGMEGAVEGAHMGHPDFRVRNRIFATLRGDEVHGMVKLTPDQQVRFIREHPAAFAAESGAWGRAGCTRVTLAAVDEETLGEAMTLAWQNLARAGARSPRARTARPGSRAAPRRAARPHSRRSR